MKNCFKLVTTCLCFLAMGVSIPSALATNVSSVAETLVCNNLPSLWSIRAVFNLRFSGGTGGTEYDLLTCTSNGTFGSSSTSFPTSPLTKWQITVSILNQNGVVVASNSASGGGAQGSVTAQTTSGTSGTASVSSHA